MQIFAEAGVFAFVALALFLGGVVAAARDKAVEPWALSILAAGAVGVGLGQRLVASAVDATDALEDKVAILSVGTREVSANLLIAGTFAGLLLGVAVVARLRRA